MSKSDNYFMFPLVALWGEKYYKKEKTPLYVLETCLSLGIVNAAQGYLKRNGEDKFNELLKIAYDERIESGQELSDINKLSEFAKIYIVGCKVSGVSSSTHEEHMTNITRKFLNDSHYSQAPYVKLKASFLWNALETARYEQDPISCTNPDPSDQISWNEFRVLCAILSTGANREGFQFIGWESIQARSTGFKSKEELTNGKTIPQHVPKLSRQQIRRVLANLERNKFFLRFRHSTGKRGGWTAYSFRHKSRDELGEAVGRMRAFQSGQSLIDNRSKDLSISQANKAKYEQQTLDI